MNKNLNLNNKTGGMYQRDSNAAFDNAKKDASFQPKEFMYMYSMDGHDYFKNTFYRNYVNFKQ